MRAHHASVLSLGLLICAAAPNSPAQAAAAAVPVFSLTNLGDFVGGEDFSRAAAINDFGQVVGQSTGPSATLPFLWTPSSPNGSIGSMTALVGMTNGTGNSYAAAINASGQVAGGGSIIGGGGRPYLWSPAAPNGATGSMVTLGKLSGGGNFSEAKALNDYGQITGLSNATTATRGFLWTPSTANGTTGTMIDLGAFPSGGGFSTGASINSRGQVVGVSSVADGAADAFLWNPSSPNTSTGSMISLGRLPDGATSSASGINATGQAAGSSGRAFLWTPDTPNGTAGSMLDLGDLPGGYDSSSSALALNDDGWVVGTSYTDDGYHAFLWTATDGMLDLNARLQSGSGPSWILREATGINSSGQIVGWGRFDPDNDPLTDNAVDRAFLLTVVPEPGSLLLAAPLLLLRRRRV